MIAILKFLENDLDISFQGIKGNNKFKIYDIKSVNMKEVQNLILSKDRAVNCLLWINDPKIGKLAQFLITLSDEEEIEEKITTYMEGYRYDIIIDKNFEYVEFLKEGEKKPYIIKKSSCSCPGWIFSKKPKSCKHIKMFSLMGIELKEKCKNC